MAHVAPPLPEAQASERVTVALRDLVRDHPLARARAHKSTAVPVRDNFASARLYLD
jgi:hypothetical protein